MGSSIDTVSAVADLEIGRFLDFGSRDAVKNGQGLCAQLLSLQLSGALHAQSLSSPYGGSSVAGMLGACRQHLQHARETPQVQQFRLERLREAQSFAAVPPDLTRSVKGKTAREIALQSNSLAGLLRDAPRAKQLLHEVSAALAQKMAKQQHPDAATPMDTEGCLPSSLQERKRRAEGTSKQPVSKAAASRWGVRSHIDHEDTSTAAGAAAAAGGGGTSSGPHIPVPATLRSSRHKAPNTAAGAAAGAGDDPIDVYSSDDEAAAPTPHRRGRAAAGAAREGAAFGVGKVWGPPRQQQQQQDARGPARDQEGSGVGAAAGAGGGAGALPSGRSGFTSARTQLVADLHKKGQHQQANMFQALAPRAGLSRNRGRGGASCQAAAAGGDRNGFVPPFVSKALQAHNSNGGNNGGQHRGGGGGGQAAAGGGPGGEEGPLSARTLELLGVGEDGELPPELQKHDPRLIEQVCNEVIDTSGNLSWEDIAGLHTAKALIKEIVVWPMLAPDVFTGPRAPPKGILLFGPPGTGKTLIGKAIASNIKASFFSISASSLTSKWIGEGEKMVKTLFAVAGCLQPSVIFIDEIDSILSARKSEGEHEASRRLKTEMLVQMEGCDPTSTARKVLLIGATNRPEELDEAARRRMPKQLYIPLPCAEARHHMILRQLGPGARVAAQLSDPELDKVVAKTEGYSGSDMRNLIQEACQGPVRDAVARLGERVAELSDADLRPVRLRDFQHAAKAQRASVTSAEIQRYEDYNQRHGARYVSLQEGSADADMEDEEEW